MRKKKSQSVAKKRHAFLREFAFILLGLCLYTIFWEQTIPVFSAVSYHYDDHQKQIGSMPLSIDSNGDVLTANVRMLLSPLHPVHFTIAADDCLNQLTINGKEVLKKKDESCDFTLKQTVDLRQYLKSGENSLRFIVEDYGGKGGIDMQPSATDPVIVLQQFLFFAIIGLGIFVVSKNIRRLKGSMLPWMFFGGVVARWWYFIATPASVRSHDYDAHLEYILYVLRHWSIPSTMQGWESFQPPLYYFLSALWLRMTSIVDIAGINMEARMQLLSVFLSIGTLAVALWIGTMFYPEQKNKWKFALFASLVAVSPSLLLLSPSINNDSLLHLLAFLSFALLLRWWNTKGRISRGFWIAACVTIALGILTKSNMIPLVGIAWILLALKKISWKEKAILFGISAVIFLFLTDWLYLLRYVTEGKLTIVGNLNTLSSGLLVKTSLSHLFAFPPVFIFQNPFNDPWADALGRQFFLTYLFRSAFFGEFSFYPLLHLAQGMLALALLAVPLFVFGFCRDIVKNFRRSLPLAVAFLVLLAVHFVFRIQTPYSSSEDFRYSILMVIPVIAFVIDGAYALPKWLRRLGLGLLWLLAIACAAFFILIPFVM